MAKEIIEFENGVVGTISIGGVKTAGLNFFEILVNGRKFVCNEKSLGTFEDWLGRFLDETLDLTFLYSMHVEPPKRNKRSHDANNQKAKIQPEADGNKICYHCTVKATKDEVRSFFEDKRERLKEMARILSRVYLRSVQNREKDKTNAYQFLGKEPGSHNNPSAWQMNIV